MFRDLFGDLGIRFFAICFGIWGFVFLVRDLFGALGIFAPLVWGFLFAICLGIWGSLFFRDLFGDLGIVFSRFVRGLGFFFVICLGIWGFLHFFFREFVWRFGISWIFVFRDLFGDFGICFFEIRLGIWGSVFSRFVWGFVDSEFFS